MSGTTINISGNSNDTNLVLGSASASISDNSQLPVPTSVSNELFGLDLVKGLNKQTQKVGADDLENMIINEYVLYYGRDPSDAELASAKSIVITGGLNELHNNLIPSSDYLNLRNLNPVQDLSGKVIVITGMSSGFGFLYALQSALRGARVVGYARTPEIFTASRLSAAATDRDNLAHPFYVGPINVAQEVLNRIDFQVCDARKLADVSGFYGYVEQTYGTNIYSIIINHGANEINDEVSNTYISLEDDISMTPTRFTDIYIKSNSSINTNMWGNIFNNKYAIELLKKSTDSHKQIIYTNSISPLESFAPNDYSISKTHGLFFEVVKMSNSLRQHNIKVNAILPSFNLTDMVGTGRGLIKINWGNVEVSNNQLLFPLSDLAHFGFTNNSSSSFKNITSVCQTILDQLGSLINLKGFMYNPLTIAMGVMDLLKPTTETNTILVQDLATIPGTKALLDLTNPVAFNPSNFGITQDEYEALNQGYNKQLAMRINKHLICELLTGHYPGKEAPYGLKIRSM